MISLYVIYMNNINKFVIYVIYGQLKGQNSHYQLLVRYDHFDLFI